MPNGNLIALPCLRYLITDPCTTVISLYIYLSSPMDERHNMCIEEIVYKLPFSV